MDIAKEILNIAKAAKKASQALSVLPTSLKNQVLNQTADELSNNIDFLKAENGKDINDARKKGLSTALIDRLTLSDKIIKAMIEGIREVVQLPDPVGETVKMWRRPNNLLARKVATPHQDHLQTDHSLPIQRRNQKPSIRLFLPSYRKRTL